MSDGMTTEMCQIVKYQMAQLVQILAQSVIMGCQRECNGWADTSYDFKVHNHFKMTKDYYIQALVSLTDVIVFYRSKELTI